MIALTSVLQPRPDIRYRIIEGEAVVVRQDAAELIVLNETGARVLQLMDGVRSVAAIIDTMVEEFAAERPDIERDVVAFIGELTELGATEQVA
jgi:coenzyme PQQ biosynthesis protein PqqD